MTRIKCRGQTGSRGRHAPWPLAVALADVAAAAQTAPERPKVPVDTEFAACFLSLSLARGFSNARPPRRRFIADR
jgi:hypothetical protein